MFNLIDDPYEEHNLFDEASCRQRVGALTARLSEIPKGQLLKLRKGSRRGKVTNEEKEKLKSLGCVR